MADIRPITDEELELFKSQPTADEVRAEAERNEKAGNCTTYFPLEGAYNLTVLESRKCIARIEADALTISELEGKVERLENPWQPIETAPDDGTHVDLWSAYCQARIPNCWWNKKEHRWIDVDRDEYVEDDLDMQLSHWMKPPRAAPFPAEVTE